MVLAVSMLPTASFSVTVITQEEEEEEDRLWKARALPPLRIDSPLKCLVSTSSIFRLLITALVTRQALLGALPRDLQSRVVGEVAQSACDGPAEAWVQVRPDLILLPFVDSQSHGSRVLRVPAGVVVPQPVTELQVCHPADPHACHSSHHTCEHVSALCESEPG